MSNRKSKQRELILKVLSETKSHPTADWVYEQARKEMSSISLGTVYRNLRLLKDQNEIQEIQSGTSGSRFDATVENHYHFRCQSCGGVFDIDMPVRKEIEDEVARQTGLTIFHHHLELYGLCFTCQSGVVAT
jgi:Fur family ferric uptake transcriptional regulator/Fur family peroxide stress response transcriptional regulator